MKADQTRSESELHRLLQNLRVILLLREDLRSKGLLHCLYSAIAAVAGSPHNEAYSILFTKASQSELHTPVAKSAILACHEVLRSAQLSAAPQEADAGRPRDLCSFANCPGRQLDSQIQLYTVKYN